MINLSDGGAMMLARVQGHLWELFNAADGLTRSLPVPQQLEGKSFLYWEGGYLFYSLQRSVWQAAQKSDPPRLKSAGRIW